MVKINELKRIAHRYGLKMSHTAAPAMDVLVRELAYEVCKMAVRKKSPKLYGEHFASVTMTIRQRKV